MNEVLPDLLPVLPMPAFPFHWRLPERLSKDNYLFDWNRKANQNDPIWVTQEEYDLIDKHKECMREGGGPFEQCYNGCVDFGPCTFMESFKVAENEEDLDFPIRSDGSDGSDDDERGYVTLSSYEGTAIYFDKEMTQTISKDELIEGLSVYVNHNNEPLLGTTTYRPEYGSWYVEISPTCSLWVLFSETRRIWHLRYSDIDLNETNPKE